MTTLTPTVPLGLADRHPFLIPGIAGAAVALSAVAALPIEYYDFVRGALVAFGLIMAAMSIAGKRYWWILGATAIVQIWSPNGAAWIHPGRAGFIALDIFAAAYFILGGIFIPHMQPLIRDGKPSKLQTWWFYTLAGTFGVLISAVWLIMVGTSDTPDH